MVNNGVDVPIFLTPTGRSMYPSDPRDNPDYIDPDLQLPTAEEIHDHLKPRDLSPQGYNIIRGVDRSVVYHGRHGIFVPKNTALFTTVLPNGQRLYRGYAHYESGHTRYRTNGWRETLTLPVIDPLYRIPPPGIAPPHQLGEVILEPDITVLFLRRTFEFIQSQHNAGIVYTRQQKGPTPHLT